MTRLRLAALFAGLFAGTLFLFAQKPFQQYHETAEGYSDYPLPAFWDTPAEWVFARLKYPDIARFQNGVDLYWTMDYPRGDRHINEGVRRLTSVDVRAVEQVVDLDGSDDVYNWPFLYAVEVGYWDPTEAQAAQLRTFLGRGGFLMVDDFHNEEEWNQFEYVMDMVLPGHDVVDLTVADQIFHTVSDIQELVQIPSAQYMRTGVTYEKGGVIPHFRGIRDAKGRLAVVICHNMDLGDSVEHSDNPLYPERFASLGFKVFTNYVVYALSH